MMSCNCIASEVFDYSSDQIGKHSFHSNIESRRCS